MKFLIIAGVLDIIIDLLTQIVFVASETLETESLISIDCESMMKLLK